MEATNSDTTDLICDETTVLTIHCPLISLNLARTDAAPTQKLISSSPLFSAQCMGWRALFKSVHYHAGRAPNQAATGSRTFWSLIRGFPELDPYYLLTVCVGLCRLPREIFPSFCAESQTKREIKQLLLTLPIQRQRQTDDIERHRHRH